MIYNGAQIVDLETLPCYLRLEIIDFHRRTSIRSIWSQLAAVALEELFRVCDFSFGEDDAGEVYLVR